MKSFYHILDFVNQFKQSFQKKITTLMNKKSLIAIKLSGFLFLSQFHELRNHIATYIINWFCR